MIGSESIDLSLKNIWRSWCAFRKGKRATSELHAFQYCLEKNLFSLFCDLKHGTYVHGNYKKFTVYDPKQREISVAPIRDRVVHRLIYDELVPIYDKTFLFDVWSCRKGKGLLGAIERAQYFLKKYPNAFVWRTDIKKFFDSVNREVLLKILTRKIKVKKFVWLLREVIYGDNLQLTALDKNGMGGGRNPNWQSYEPDFRKYLFQRI